MSPPREPLTEDGRRLMALLRDPGLRRVNRYHVKRAVDEFEVGMTTEGMFVSRARTILRKAGQLPPELELPPED